MERSRYLASPQADAKIEGNNESKPPRPPSLGAAGLGAGAKGVATSATAGGTHHLTVSTNASSNSGSGSGSGSGRVLTPPRQGGNPGHIPVDDNFVEEDWDRSMDFDSPGDVPIRKVGNGKNKRGDAAGTITGIRPDDHWLDENFDD